MIWLLFFSCAVPDAPPPSDAVEWLIRASLDLRGVRPSLAELDAVESGESEMSEMVDDYLHDERFEERVADLYAEVFRTRNEEHFVELIAYELEWSEGALAESIGNEPLRMLGHLAANDLPYTDLVTGNWTMADPLLGSIWPVAYPDGGQGWERVSYTDGRPAVGVLASNGLWWHYGSMENNLNRGRANQISRLFLCHDFLAQEINFSANQILTTEDALGEAIETDPACTSCHATLDPLASHLFGFWWFGPQKAIPTEIAVYHPEREQEWRWYTGKEPAYFGTVTSGLVDLGELIAADTRYPRCLVERSFELLLRRDVAETDMSDLNEHEDVFLASGVTLRPLLRSIVLSDAYQDRTTHALKMVTPELLSSQVTDLTGFEWHEGDHWNLVTAPNLGFHRLAGGADGVLLTQSAREPSMTLLLVQERLAEAAAEFVVLHDYDHPDEARLLGGVDFDHRPATHSDALAQHLSGLIRRVLGRRVAADSDEVLALLDLWSELFALDEDPIYAWTGVVAALLRDPDLLLY